MTTTPDRRTLILQFGSHLYHLQATPEPGRYDVPVHPTGHGASARRLPNGAIEITYTTRSIDDLLGTKHRLKVSKGHDGIDLYYDYNFKVAIGGWEYGWSATYRRYSPEVAAQEREQAVWDARDRARQAREAAIQRAEADAAWQRGLATMAGNLADYSAREQQRVAQQQAMLDEINAAARAEAEAQRRAEEQAARERAEQRRAAQQASLAAAEQRAEQYRLAQQQAAQQRVDAHRAAQERAEQRRAAGQAPADRDGAAGSSGGTATSSGTPGASSSAASSSSSSSRPVRPAPSQPTAPSSSGRKCWTETRTYPQRSIPLSSREAAERQARLGTCPPGGQKSYSPITCTQDTEPVLERAPGGVRVTGRRTVYTCSSTLTCTGVQVCERAPQGGASAQ